MSFIANPNTQCIPACFGMGLAYFSPEKQYSMEDLEEFCCYKEGHGMWKAVAMLNLAKLGYHVHWIEQIEYDETGNTGEKYIGEGDDVHLEHIVPQTINTKKSKEDFGDWISYLGDKAEEIHKDKVVRIGNMTLLSALNSTGDLGKKYLFLF